ncbi:MAG: hypothetical protein KatS3mg087_0074 [Patescibacteria group bacterium]|nr:MAG: hypothetical protein KatS3mg087_0074 [Patescibacteria group bacterium]
MKMNVVKSGNYLVVKVFGKTRDEVSSQQVRTAVLQEVSKQGYVVDAIRIDNPVYPVDENGEPLFKLGEPVDSEKNKKLAGFCAEYYIYVTPPGTIS